jgi:CubicO group peptidase (beta-lactamase class C family)
MKAALILAAAVLVLPSPCASQSVPDLSGLWAASQRWSPDIEGPLLLLETPGGWRVDFAGYSLAARNDGGTITFELPGGGERVRGRVVGQAIRGHWIQAPTVASGLGYATPVILEPDGPGRWRGAVAPFASGMTYYFPVERRPGGGYRTYLRNPERNDGRFFPVTRLALDGNEVRFLGRRGQADTVLETGRFDDGVMTVRLRGGMYDFTRLDDSTASGFFPRGRPAPRYRYAPPLQLDDGWPVASVDEVGVSREGIERFIQMLLDMPMDSVTTPQVDGVLIARHGKLVVEEYFHGFHRDLPHDLRSASKSWVAVLIGAAMKAGVPIRIDTPVYRTLLGTLPPDLDPRKRAMTLEHLISMTAGFQCDPDASPTADEDVIQQSGARDWYRVTLDVPLVSAPGEKIFYCSAEPNLAAGMLEKLAREPLPELFDRLVARPLRMGRYHLMLQPTGEAYGGGGHRFVPRDFMKLAQLMANDGRWEGQQILDPDWVRRSSAPLRDLSPVQQYGWLWNSHEYEYGNRKVRGYFAGGNGGQVFMAIPELDLVVAFTGGNYGQAATFTSQRVFMPQHVLPAVLDSRSSSGN